VINLGKNKNKKDKTEQKQESSIKFPPDMLDEPVFSIDTAIEQLSSDKVKGKTKNFVELSMDQLF